MARKVFYSFHYAADAWRASQVRNIGVVEGNVPAADNKWEEVKKGGDSAIQKWIDDQLVGRSCTVVLVGAETANRKWIDYEIKKSWNDKKGLLGIRIHNLLNNKQQSAVAGLNPFAKFNLDNGQNLSSLANLYDPPFSTSTKVYEHIKSNLAKWIEDAVKDRS